MPDGTYGEWVNVFEQHWMEQAEHPAQLKRAVHGRPRLSCVQSAHQKTESSYHAGRHRQSASPLQQSRQHPSLQQNADLCYSCGAKVQMSVTPHVCIHGIQAGTCSSHVETILLHLDNITCREKEPVSTVKHSCTSMTLALTVLV